MAGADLPHCDADDLRPLNVLARDGRTGPADLAAATGWSPSTVRRRMDELRAGGAFHFYAEFDLAHHVTAADSDGRTLPGQLYCGAW